MLAINNISLALNLKPKRGIIEHPKNELYGYFNLSI